MDKKFLLAGILGIAVLGLIVFFSTRSGDKTTDQNKENADVILFYGIGCPHCENVDKFIEENGVREKIAFEKLEVFKNKENFEIMRKKAETCGLDQDSLGVPFLWNKGQCFSGDVDIIDQFKSQIGEQQ